MKYYCKQCGSTFESGKRLIEIPDYCPLCGEGLIHIVKIPDYETPAQYHARTGKSYPDKGLVWACSHTHYDSADPYGWQVKQYFELTKDDYCVLIASPPIPPPDDFVPREGGK